MEDRALLQTFASGSRMKILSSLSATPRSASKIAHEVSLSSTAVRFHLQKLLRLGLIEETEERGKVGRPRILYRATGKRVEMAFPARNYLYLSEVLIRALIATYDERELHERLRRAGEELGSYLAKNIIEKTGLEKLSAEAFAKNFVEGLLKEFGTQPEVVKQASNRVQYRLNNCPFKELAVKYPSLICEDLDDSINIALCRHLNPNTEWKKLKCLGHGDPYCEYLVSWSSTAAEPNAGSREEINGGAS